MFSHKLHVIMRDWLATDNNGQTDKRTNTDIIIA